MDNVDLNLIIALDALLTENSVTAAARRLGLSPSAMSRTLKRLRSTTGDPLLVRAGRGLTPTPYAASLRARVHDLAQNAQAVLRPRSDAFDITRLERTFTIRANEAFIAFFSVPLLTIVTATAPGVRLHFAPKPNKDPAPLRLGPVDLEIGVVETSASDMHARPLFRDRMVGVARMGHPLLTEVDITPQRYAACEHVVATPKGDVTSPVDDALDALGLRRKIRVIVPGFPDAVRIARHSDLIALVPRSCLGNACAGEGSAAAGLEEFELPVQIPQLTISAIWHPRMHNDPAHRWLRDCVASLCAEAYPTARHRPVSAPPPER
ncbi:LysR family transcriptional regulator [Oleiagrimonas sp. MCCC 1A03011]|uniref:LysR family transcriptional regulator n=1 Tax=Oleiagrimonas sp. MCCC 1A03011 TaxID=1926883 RepID=UPI000DC4600B|nr:LysR family transcriptional regulator [Oleiagrimonas sp. MCCC 1A03011]RAP56328.1 LysR family transcriptional regulator [Oleiagrimonas sp. MCCC 1A03011]